MTKYSRVICDLKRIWHSFLLDICLSAFWGQGWDEGSRWGQRMGQGSAWAVSEYFYCVLKADGVELQSPYFLHVWASLTPGGLTFRVSVTDLGPSLMAVTSSLFRAGLRGRNVFLHKQWLKPFSWWLSQPPLCSLLQGLLRRMACLTLQLGLSCLSQWRSCMRSCTNWKCSMCSACCWWGVSETRLAPPHVSEQEEPGANASRALVVCRVSCSAASHNGSVPSPTKQGVGFLSPASQVRKPVWFQSP